MHLHARGAGEVEKASELIEKGVPSWELSDKDRILLTKKRERNADVFMQMKAWDRSGPDRRKGDRRKRDRRKNADVQRMRS